MKTRLNIGLDLGQTTGLAIYDREKKDWSLVTSGLWLDMIRYIKTFSPDTCTIYIEDTRKIKAIYSRHMKEYERKINNSTINRITMSDLRKLAKIAQNIGGVKVLGLRTQELLEIEGYTVKMVPPVREPKWNARTALRMTGYTGQTNQHSRDSMRLIIGR